HSGGRTLTSTRGLDAPTDASRTHCPTATSMRASFHVPTDRPERRNTMTSMNPNVDESLQLSPERSHSFDRRTLVVGAAGALVAAALGGSARAAHFSASAG